MMAQGVSEVVLKEVLLPLPLSLSFSSLSLALSLSVSPIHSFTLFLSLSRAQGVSEVVLEEVLRRDLAAFGPQVRVPRCNLRLRILVRASFGATDLACPMWSRDSPPVRSLRRDLASFGPQVWVPLGIPPRVGRPG